MRLAASYFHTCPLFEVQRYIEFITSVVQASGGYSGSDIRLVCKEAAMSAMREAFSVLETCKNGNILCNFQITKLMVF